MSTAGVSRFVVVSLLSLAFGPAIALAQQPPASPVLSVDDASISWTGVAGATGYDLLRGDLRTLRDTGGDFTIATRVCLADDWGAQALAHAGVPGPGEAFWFLVRASAGTQAGSYDSGGAGQAGSRDAEIETAPPACLSPVVPHAQIAIDFDAGFTAANGVVGGSGTAADPYVIAGWSITCPSTGFHTGISLWRTTRPFVIRNVTLQGCTWGINMYSAPNGRIERSRAQGGNHGAVLDDCDDFTVEGYRVSNISATGISVYRSANVIVKANTIVGGFAGIMLDNSTGCLVHDNNLVGNALQASDSPGGANTWDAGYPGGGNYWTNYQGIDECGGPAQDDCSAPDGMGDTPYLLNAVTADRYPRMVPDFAEGDTVPPDVAIASPAAGAVFMTVPITVSGSASDDSSGLRRVEVSVNGGPWAIANGTTSWNLSVGLAPGPNTIEARSLDHAGNVSTIGSISVTYDAPIWQAVLQTDKATYVRGAPVAIAFTLTNRSAFPVTLHFSTTCQAFFRVADAAGSPVFDARNHAGCFFVFTQRTWQPNQSVTYQFTWTQVDDDGQQVPVPGDYRIRGFMDSAEEVPEAEQIITIEP